MNKIFVSISLIFILFFIQNTCFAQTNSLDTALLGAVKRNDFTLVKQLVKEGANVNYQDKYLAPVIMWAANVNNLEMVNFLVGKGADVKKKGLIIKESFIIGNLNGLAVVNKNLHMLRYFIEKCSIDINDKEIDENGSTENGWDALEYAKRVNSPEIIEYLLKKGKIIHISELIEFDLDENLLINFLKNKYDSLILKDINDNLLIHKSIQYRKFKLLKYLILNKVEINKQDTLGRTALYYSIFVFNYKAAELLINEGADVNICSNYGESPLSLSQRRGSQKIIKLLLLKNAVKKDIIYKNYDSIKPELVIPYRTSFSKAIFSPKSENDPDGGKLFASFGNSNITIWDSKTGAFIYNLKGHTHYVYKLNFSFDGRLLLSGSDDYTAKLWNIKSGQLIHSLDGHSAYVMSAIFSNKSKFDSSGSSYVLTSSRDGTAKLWDAASGKIIYNLLNCGEVNSAVFSPDGERIITSSSCGSIKIWDTKTGKTIHTINGPKAYVFFVKFNPSGSLLLSASADNKVNIWNASNYKLIKSFKYLELNNTSVDNACFSPDGKLIVVAVSLKNVDIYDSKTFRLIHTLKSHENGITQIKFSNSGRYLITLNENENKAKIWDVLNGTLIDSFISQNRLNSVTFSEDEKYILTSEFSVKQPGIKLWDFNDKKVLKSYTGNSVEIYYGQLFANDSFIFTQGINGTHLRDINKSKEIYYFGSNMKYDIKKNILYSVSDSFRIFNAQNGKKINCFKLPSHENQIFSSVFSHDKKLVLILKCSSELKVFRGGRQSIADRIGNTAYLYDLTTSKEIYSIKCDGITEGKAEFSPEGQMYLLICADSTIKLFNTSDGKYIRSLKGHKSIIEFAIFSPPCLEDSLGGKYILSASYDGNIILWETSSGRIVYKIRGYGYPQSLSFNRKGDSYVITGLAQDASVYEVSSGKLLYSCGESSSGINDAKFSSDGKYIVTSGTKGVNLWNALDGKLLYSFKSQINFYFTANFTPDNKKIIKADGEGGVKIWDVASGKELGTYIFIDSIDWLLITPSGLFDASSGAMSKMHFHKGLEIIEFNQLKDRYYEPGLGSKILGLSNEPLRDVVSFSGIKMYPSVKLSIENTLFNYTLIDRGGGIGKYTIYINGKEAFIGNQPESGIIFKGGNELTSTYDLKNHPYLIAGKRNEIMIKAYNGENYLVSRGDTVGYFVQSAPAPEKPNLYIIASGVSDYTGDQIDLKYAAKDAEDIANSLQIGAKRLFGTESTFTFKLTTNNADKTQWPTKENIRKTFEEVAKKAKSSDILVVYVSGHGINWGGQDGDFYYLTQDAYTGNIDAYNDPGIREKTTISSAELTELIKKVPALKQVLILDACGSGRTVENLMAKRDIPSSTLRALDRMKDRTGLHIITGCAADAVSYEASRYGQGILTYSLLEGIKGASLREDKFVDVVKLFQYSRDRVPQLAQGIGGIQEPQLFSPYGETSFDVGEIENEDKPLIPLAKAKPMFLMSSFQETESMDDVLGFEKAVDDKLREQTIKGFQAPLIFIETKEFPDAYRIRGRYSIVGNKISVQLNIFKGSEKINSSNLIGYKDNKDKLLDQIIEKSLDLCK